ncbi:hypothetical protein D5b_00033 [Faustovirus]|nr:hypothetical protein D5b_00033 [Faustovirus]AMP43992.1 hypothetical protein PRJ_Dakar_00032 [Faustovirus]
MSRDSTIHPGYMVEFDADVKLENGDKFVFSKGKHFADVRRGKHTRKLATRWWELVCYRGGLKSWHVRVVRGQIHLKIIRLYARIDPIMRFVNMILRTNRAAIGQLLEHTRCHADKCIYALNTYMIYCEFNNPEGMIVYKNKQTGKECRKLIKINPDVVPALANMAIKQETAMRRPNIQPQTADAGINVDKSGLGVAPKVRDSEAGSNHNCGRQCARCAQGNPQRVAVNAKLNSNNNQGPKLSKNELDKLAARVDVLRGQLNSGLMTPGKLLDEVCDLVNKAAGK